MQLTRRAWVLGATVVLVSACKGGANSPSRVEKRGLPRSVEAVVYVDLARLRGTIGDKAFADLAKPKNTDEKGRLVAFVAERASRLDIGLRGIPPVDTVMIATGKFDGLRDVLDKGWEEDPDVRGALVRKDGVPRGDAAWILTTPTGIVVASAAMVEPMRSLHRGDEPPTELEAPRDSVLGLSFAPRGTIVGLGKPIDITASVDAHSRGLVARVAVRYADEAAAKRAMEKTRELLTQLRSRGDTPGIIARGIGEPTASGPTVAVRVEVPLSALTRADGPLQLAAEHVCNSSCVVDLNAFVDLSASVHNRIERERRHAHGWHGYL